MASVRLSKIVDEEFEERASLTNRDNMKDLEESVPLDETEQKEKAKKKKWDHYLAYVSLVILVVQNTSQVLLMRYATTRPGTPFLKTAAVFFNEVLKLIAATILFIVSSGSIKTAFREFHRHFIMDFMGTLKVAVPALIYTIQNFLLYVAIDNLDAPTYMVTYQLKILTTALFTVLMLKRRLSPIQWFSLLVLIAGVVLVQSNAGKSPSIVSDNSTVASNSSTTMIPTTTVDPENSRAVDRPWVGLLAVLTACVLSGFAGVYFEKILKGSDVSIWLRNIQLSALSLPISMIVITIKDYNKVMNNGGLLQGFDSIVWGVVALQALGGLVVAAVIKYADNILKAFATSVAIIVSSVASIFLFSLIPELMFMAGAALVIGAVVLYGVFPYKARPSSVEVDEKPKIDDELAVTFANGTNEVELPNRAKDQDSKA